MSKPNIHRDNDIFGETVSEPVVRLLAESLDPVPVPLHLKARVMESIAKEEAHSRLGAIRQGEGEWQATPFAGVSFKTLFVDAQTGMHTNLVRMAPGSVYPAHRHSQAEQCMIMEGDLVCDGEVFRAGDFTWGLPNSLHASLSTRSGNLLLVVASPGDEVYA